MIFKKKTLFRDNLMTQKTFDDLVFKTAPTICCGDALINGFHRARIHFNNGYGISVICGDVAYSEPRRYLNDPLKYYSYEVAVLYDNEVCSTTKITGDILSYLTKEEINEVIKKVSRMRKKTGLTTGYHATRLA